MSDLRRDVIVAMLRDSLLTEVAVARLLTESYTSFSTDRDTELAKALERYADDRARNIASWLLPILEETAKHGYVPGIDCECGDRECVGHDEPTPWGAEYDIKALQARLLELKQALAAAQKQKNDKEDDCGF